MFKLSLSKNLNRLAFLKAQLTCLVLLALTFIATASLHLLLNANQMQEFLLILAFGLLVAFGLALYLFSLSICNITGRLRNISDRDIWVLWGIYIVSGLVPDLKIFIFLIPTGYFNRKAQ